MSNDKFVMNPGQIAQLDRAFVNSNWTPGDVYKLCDRKITSAILRIIRGSADILEKSPRDQALPNRIKVNRQVRPACPVFVKVIAHPELETLGPDEYDLGEVKLWRHKDQQGKQRVSIFELYMDLKIGDLLPHCLGLADGYAISRKQAPIYRKFFGGQTLFLWRSVMIGEKGSEYFVPYLRERKDGPVEWVEMTWLSFRNASLPHNSPAAYFPPK